MYKTLLASVGILCLVFDASANQKNFIGGFSLVHRSYINLSRRFPSCFIGSWEFQDHKFSSLFEVPAKDSCQISLRRKHNQQMLLNQINNGDRVKDQNEENRLILSSVCPQRTTSGKCTLYDGSYDKGRLEVKVKVSNQAQRQTGNKSSGLPSSPLAKEYANYKTIVKKNPVKSKTYFAKQFEFITEAPVVDLLVNDLHTEKSKQNKKLPKILRKDMIVMEKGIQDLSHYFLEVDEKVKPNITKNKIIKSMIESALSINQANLVWTDLRLENFILTFEDTKKKSSLKCVAIDLESCISIGGTATDCSPEVCPPEVSQFYIRGQLAGIPIQPSYDVWALGMSILRVLTDGDDLFYTFTKNNINTNRNYMSKLAQITQEEVDEILKTKSQNFLQMKKGNESFPFLFDLLEKMLKVNPNERIKITDIKFHPYFLSNIFT